MHRVNGGLFSSSSAPPTSTHRPGPVIARWSGNALLAARYIFLYRSRPLPRRSDARRPVPLPSTLQPAASRGGHGHHPAPPRALTPFFRNPPFRVFAAPRARLPPPPSARRGFVRKARSGPPPPPAVP